MIMLFTVPSIDIRPRPCQMVSVKACVPSPQFPFEDNMFHSLFYPIQTKFLDTVNTLCGRIPQVFLKQIEKTLRKVFEEKVVRHIRLHK